MEHKKNNYNNYNIYLKIDFYSIVYTYLNTLYYITKMNIIAILSYYCYCWGSNNKSENIESNISYLNNKFLEEIDVSISSIRETELSTSNTSRMSDMTDYSSE